MAAAMQRPAGQIVPEALRAVRVPAPAAARVVFDEARGELRAQQQLSVLRECAVLADAIHAPVDAGGVGA